MATYAQLTHQLGTALLEVARPVQDAVVQAFATLEGLAGKVPGLPEASTRPLVDHLQALPGLPSAREVVNANFDLAERLLAAQRTLALRLVNASAEPARVFVPAQAGAPSETETRVRV